MGYRVRMRLKDEGGWVLVLLSLLLETIDAGIAKHREKVAGNAANLQLPRFKGTVGKIGMRNGTTERKSRERQRSRRKAGRMNFLFFFSRF